MNAISNSNKSTLAVAVRVLTLLLTIIGVVEARLTLERSMWQRDIEQLQKRVDQLDIRISVDATAHIAAFATTPQQEPLQ